MRNLKNIFREYNDPRTYRNMKIGFISLIICSTLIALALITSSDLRHSVGIGVGDGRAIESNVPHHVINRHPKQASKQGPESQGERIYEHQSDNISRNPRHSSRNSHILPIKESAHTKPSHHDKTEPSEPHPVPVIPTPTPVVNPPMTQPVDEHGNEGNEGDENQQGSSS